MREIMEKDPGKKKNTKGRTRTLVWTCLSKQNQTWIYEHPWDTCPYSWQIFGWLFQNLNNVYIWLGRRWGTRNLWEGNTYFSNIFLYCDFWWGACEHIIFTTFIMKNNWFFKSFFYRDDCHSFKNCLCSGSMLGRSLSQAKQMSRDTLTADPISGPLLYLYLTLMTDR